MGTFKKNGQQEKDKNENLSKACENKRSKIKFTRVTEEERKKMRLDAYKYIV